MAAAPQSPTPLPVRVLVWGENRHEHRDQRVAELYPNGMHTTIKEGIEENLGDRFTVGTTTLDEPEHGLTEEVLANTDVLVWWGHMAHEDVSDEPVFVSNFSGGEVFRSGCTFRRGHGRIFYFSPGDQDYPVYHHKDVRKVIANGVGWAVTDRPERKAPTLERHAVGDLGV